MAISFSKLNDLSSSQALQAFHVLRQGASILTAIFLAKSALSTEDIGTYEMLFYIGYALSFFWVAGMVQGMLTSFPSLSAGDQKAFLFNAYLFFLVISGLLFVSLSLFKPQILQALTGQGELEYYELFIVYLLLNQPAFLLENFYLLKNKATHIVFFGVFSFVLHVVVVLFPIYAGWGFLWSFYGLIMLAALRHLWLLFFLTGNARFEINARLISDWARLSAPLVLYVLIGGFHFAFDNWLVNFHYRGDERVFAVFRYGARELPLALALTSAFSNSMLPLVAKDLRESLSMIRDRSRKLFHLLFPISILAVLFSHFLFPLVFNESFRDSAAIFNVFLLVIISRLVFPHTILIGLKDNKIMLVVSIIELSVNMLASFILVKNYGLVGIALGTLLAYSLEKIIIAMYLYVKHKIAFHQYTDMKWYLGYSFAMLAAFVLSFLMT